MVMQNCSSVYTFDHSLEKYYLGRQPAGFRENCTLDTCLKQQYKHNWLTVLVLVRVTFLLFMVCWEHGGWYQFLPHRTLMMARHSISLCCQHLRKICQVETSIEKEWRLVIVVCFKKRKIHFFNVILEKILGVEI